MRKEKKERYSLRKLGNHVVSVAVSAIVLSGGNVLAHAETSLNDSQEENVSEENVS
ncbi:YSIRK-type signal peptide-containing protein [Allofustis seminis]|uniref:YSIRK-type signal peptide-containing protein n=1 Tax=Allofustis seminis TaxID=166939 RepID=UPI0003699CA6|nr:YSIRK-type signal peptide-containing protein [Allofustis seminis]